MYISYSSKTVRNSTLSEKQKISLLWKQTWSVAFSSTKNSSINFGNISQGCSFGYNLEQICSKVSVKSAFEQVEKIDTSKHIHRSLRVCLIALNLFLQEGKRTLYMVSLVLRRSRQTLGWTCFLIYICQLSML